MGIKQVHIRSTTYRAISTQYPPIDLFENLCPKHDYEQACKWEMLTSDRIRNNRIPHQDCVFGDGASFVMAPFFYKTPPGRFSTDLFGGYYASRLEKTSIWEKSYHLGRFIAATEDEAFSTGLNILILKGSIECRLHTTKELPYTDPIYDKTSYTASQRIAKELYNQNSNGIAYNSVRHTNNTCYVIYKPKLVGIPIQTKKLALHFNGTQIDKYFENDNWHELPIDS
tara:strand:+ start:30 stop:710 length:681 start_codon:yes stop_codon:yes gene_type:complete